MKFHEENLNKLPHEWSGVIKWVSSQWHSKLFRGGSEDKFNGTCEESFYMKYAWMQTNWRLLFLQSFWFEIEEIHLIMSNTNHVTFIYNKFPQNHFSCELFRIGPSKESILYRKQQYASRSLKSRFHLENVARGARALHPLKWNPVGSPWLQCYKTPLL